MPSRCIAALPVRSPRRAPRDTSFGALQTAVSRTCYPLPGPLTPHQHTPDRLCERQDV